MAKIRGEPRTRKRERYSMLGNLITGGEHAPVYVHPKQRLKNAPTGEGAVANVGSLFDIGAGAVHLGLSAVFTPRKVVGAVKRGFERDVEKEKHRIKYDSAISPVFEGMIKKEDGYRDERIPSNQLTQQQIRRNAREAQGEYENGKWVANEEYEQNRMDRNEKARKNNLKAEVIGLPPVDRWNKNIPLATRQNIKLYPDVEALEKQEREYGQKMMTKEELLEEIKKRDGKNIPVNGIFRRIRGVQYDGKKFTSKHDVLTSIARHDVALMIRSAAKTPASRREPKSKFGLKSYPQRNQSSAYILDNPLMYETSLKWRKPSEQDVKTHYKQTGTPVLGGIKTNYIPTFENRSLKISSKRSKLTENEREEDRDILRQRFTGKPPLDRYKSIKFQQTLSKLKTSPASQPVLLPVIQNNPQNIKTSYKTPNQNVKSSFVPPWNYPSTFEQKVQRTYRSDLKKQDKLNKSRMSLGLHYEPIKFPHELNDLKKHLSSPVSKDDLNDYWGASHIWLSDRGMAHPLSFSTITKKSPAKKSSTKKVSPPKTTKKHPYISAADQDKIDAQKAARYRSKKAKKGGKK